MKINRRLSFIIYLLISFCQFYLLFLSMDIVYVIYIFIKKGIFCFFCMDFKRALIACLCAYIPISLIKIYFFFKEINKV